MQTRLATLSSGTSSNPVQKLNEVQLIEQVVLEPEHELVVGAGVGDDAPPLPQPLDRAFEGVSRWFGQKPRADFDQGLVRQVTRHRAFVEHIAPDRPLPGNPRGFDQARQRRAVRDVKEAFHSMIVAEAISSRPRLRGCDR